MQAVRVDAGAQAECRRLLACTELVAMTRICELGRSQPLKRS
jgi:hypothetical protein